MLKTRWTTLFVSVALCCIASIYSCTAANNGQSSTNTFEQTDGKTAPSIGATSTTKTQATNGDPKIGILPFSRLASPTVKKKVGHYYQALGVENALVAAFKKESISVKNAVLKGQQPFTYDEMTAPIFDIDPNDFATPEQILAEIASQQKFTQIIFGHVEKVSDLLLLVVHVYFESSGKMISAQEKSIEIKAITPHKVEKAIDELAIEVKQIMENPPPPKQQNSAPTASVPSSDEHQEYNFDPLSPSNTVPRDIDDGSNLEGFGKQPIGYYTVEDIYRIVLEYEFYVDPSPKPEHQQAIKLLAQNFSKVRKENFKTTKKKLIHELTSLSRSAYPVEYFFNYYYNYHNWYNRKITQVISKPKQEGKFITASTQVFKLCLFEPYNKSFGFQGLTYQEAKNTLQKIKKVQFMMPGNKWQSFSDWRIPTLKELFVITQYLPPWKYSKDTYSYWSSDLTAKEEVWTLQKEMRRYWKNNKWNYGYDIYFDSTAKRKKTLLVAVRDCP